MTSPEASKPYVLTIRQANNLSTVNYPFVEVKWPDEKTKIDHEFKTPAAKAKESCWKDNNEVDIQGSKSTIISFAVQNAIRPIFGRTSLGYCQITIGSLIKKSIAGKDFSLDLEETESDAQNKAAAEVAKVEAEEAKAEAAKAKVEADAAKAEAKMAKAEAKAAAQAKADKAQQKADKTQANADAKAEAAKKAEKKSEAAAAVTAKAATLVVSFREK